MFQDPTAGAHGTKSANAAVHRGCCSPGAGHPDSQVSYPCSIIDINYVNLKKRFQEIDTQKSNLHMLYVYEKMTATKKHKAGLAKNIFYDTTSDNAISYKGF